MSNNFSTVPNINISRSKFTARYHHKTSFNMGKLIPFDVIEVLPGDTFKLKMNEVCRISSALIRPIMDNLFLDVYYFFVPNRLSYDKWAEVMGENTKGHWVPASKVEVPTFKFLEVKQGTIADYFGLPVGAYIGVSTVFPKVSILPFNAYALIWNEYFRDENNQDPVQIFNTSKQFGNANFNWSPNNYAQAYPAPVCKLHDYFTSALPAPQKGEAVKFSLVGDAPVVDGGGENSFRLKVYGTVPSTPYAFGSSSNNNVSYLSLPNGTYSIVDTAPEFSLKAQTSNLTVANVNDLRFAFQLQKMLEKDARGGTRYREYLQSHFGVTSPDSRMQVPEFLGGARLPVSIEQVEQTTSGEGADTLGQVGAYSLSNGQSGFTKGFVEHGFVIGVMCVRQHHTYQQGLEKFWTRTKRTDFYDPVFANIGEQPIYQSELFFGNDNVDRTNTVFGYQEAWADYRYKPSRISGELRSTATNSMDIWHLGDNYANAPILGNQFLSETTEYLDRALAVPSTTANQFIIDIYTENEMIRPMPVYSVPGLIDHH